MKRTIPTLICALLALGLATTAAVAQSGGDHPEPYVEVPEPAPTTQSAQAAGAQSARRSGKKKLARRAPGGKKRMLIGFGDPLFSISDDAKRRAVMDEAVETNAKVVRLYTDWRRIAPDDPSPAFNAADPASPEYEFGTLDEAVRDAAQRGLRVILMVNEAPGWAEGAKKPGPGDPDGQYVSPGTWKPSPSEFADFGTALARRYSGSFLSLPRVRDYMAWNEPTIPTWLNPQWKGKNRKKPASPDVYRRMLNSFYKAVKGISRKNRVITAGTPPYGFPRGKYSMRPLLFWRELLCVKRNGKPQKKCKKAKFDVLAHHPINTSGGPRRSAVSPDDLSTPDLHNLVDVLRTSEKARNVKPKGKHEVWATEFWWESDPPDKAKGTPSLRKQARWYQEAIYLLWKQGATMALPYQVRDDPETPGCAGVGSGCAYQSGAYFVDGKPKPAQRAIAFPFVAERKNKKKVLVWGVGPENGKVRIQKKKGKRHKTIERMKVKPGKVFKSKVRLRKRKGKYKLRAKVGPTKSLRAKVK